MCNARSVKAEGQARVAEPDHAGLGVLDQRLADGEAPLLGAHILSPRRAYLHHGIYTGHGLVVHYPGFLYGILHGPVEEVSLAQFGRGRGVWMRSGQSPEFDVEEIIRRARSRVGEDRYHLLHNNCEHFCEWCIRGEPRSYQVERLFGSPRALASCLQLIERWNRRRALLPTAPESQENRNLVGGQLRMRGSEHAIG